MIAAPLGIACPRCPAIGFQTEVALMAHFQEHHAMPILKAKREAALALGSNGHPTPILPAQDLEPAAHVCACGALIPCDYESIARIRQHAARLTMIAAKWDERKRNGRVGKQRANLEWTDAQARELVASGLSYRRVGQLLSADPETIAAAVRRG